MKCYVYRDDWYVNGIDTERKEVEVPDELYERFIKAQDEFGKAQSELERYVCE